jgi:hypothetical protein
MDLEAQLSSLPADRRRAVASWLLGSVGDCASCGKAVRRIDPRRTEKEGCAHISCADAATTLSVVSAASEDVSPAVEARSRRSDWG